MAILAAAAGQAALAVHLAASAEALRDLVGLIWVLPERGVYEDTSQSLRTVLGEATFLGAWDAGRMWPLDDAIAQGEAVLAAILTATPGATSARTPSTA